MLIPGNLVPDAEVMDLKGGIHHLWDYRQKSHVALLYNPSSREEKFEACRKAVQINESHWDWMNVSFLMLTRLNDHFENGMYIIDRYGRLIKFHPGSEWTLEDVEKELTYYEARHC
jgi:hypothetical protein